MSDADTEMIAISTNRKTVPIDIAVLELQAIRESNDWLLKFYTDMVHTSIISESGKAEGTIQRVRDIGPVDDSWGASHEFKDGWDKCLEQVHAELEKK